VPPATALAQANQDVLLRHFKASIVLVNPKGQILHFYGETERYLGHPKGPASLNVLDMITGTLSAKLRRAMEQALKHDEAVKIPRAPVPRAGTPAGGPDRDAGSHRAGGRQAPGHHLRGRVRSAFVGCRPAGVGGMSRS
jgi:hypothetical protein